MRISDWSSDVCSSDLGAGPENFQRGLAVVRIGREEILRAGYGVGEVAAPAAGHQDLLAGLVGMLDDEHPPAAPPRRDRAHQPCRAGADHHGIECLSHRVSVPAWPAPCPRWLLSPAKCLRPSTRN